MENLPDDRTLWYCGIVFAIGVGALFAVFRLGRLLSERNLLGLSKPWPELFHELLNYYQRIGFKANIPRHLVESNRDYLQRRNEFWTTYLQVVVAVLIVIILALLLITKTITAEAGLPILSAVAGFAISKSTSSNTNNGGDSERDRQS